MDVTKNTNMLVFNQTKNGTPNVYGMFIKKVTFKILERESRKIWNAGQKSKLIFLISTRWRVARFGGNSTSQWRSWHARRSQRADLLPMSPSVLRRDDRLRQPRRKCIPLPKFVFRLLISRFFLKVSDRMVPLCLRRPHDQAQGQMVLPQVHTGSEEKVISDCLLWKYS